MYTNQRRGGGVEVGRCGGGVKMYFVVADAEAIEQEGAGLLRSQNVLLHVKPLQRKFYHILCMRSRYQVHSGC